MFFSLGGQEGLLRLGMLRQSNEGTAHNRIENIDLNVEQASDGIFFPCIVGVRDRCSIIFMQVMVILLGF